MRTLLALVASSLVASSFVLVGCSTNAATGKRTLTLLSRDQEIAMGAEAAPQFTTEFGGAVPDASLQAYVTRIGQKMAKETEADNPALPWEFTLLNTDVVNAFALPGGKVFFTRGLAERLTTEAQMAGVIGHEIAHVTARHGNQRISSQIGLNAVLAGAAIGVGLSDQDTAFRRYGQYALPAIAVGGNLVLLKYGRDEELEADRLGVRYMANVGYNPRGQMEVMGVLAQLSQGSSQPAFLSTHPNPEDRVKQIQSMLAGEYASTQGNANYKDFKNEYKTQFLDVIKKIPPATKSTPKAWHPPQTLPDEPVLAASAMWCAHCAAESQAVPAP
ncbi:MAG: M48 family metalloprotease [Phycisphaerales bacterium]